MEAATVVPAVLTAVVAATALEPLTVKSATSDFATAGAKLIGVSDALAAVNTPLLSNAPAAKVPAVNLPPLVASVIFPRPLNGVLCAKFENAFAT